MADFISKELELAMDVVVAQGVLEGLHEFYWHNDGAWDIAKFQKLRIHLDKYYDYFMKASGHVK